MTSLSVIINTYPPRFRELEKCLKALVKQNFQDFEIIVVNDGNDSETANVIANSKNFRPISYFYRNNDRCLSRSRNIGAKNAQGKYLVFLDSKMLAAENCLQVYQRGMSKASWQTIFYGSYGTFYEKSGLRCEDVRTVFHSERLKSLLEDPFSQKKLPFFYPFFSGWGASIGISRFFFEQLNGFDEDYVGHGYEDFAFGLRAYQRKSSFCFLADAWSDYLPQLDRDKNFYNQELMGNNEKIFSEQSKSLREIVFATKQNDLLVEWDLFFSLINDKKNYGEIIKSFLLAEKKFSPETLFNFSYLFTTHPKYFYDGILYQLLVINFPNIDKEKKEKMLAETKNILKI